MRYTVTTLEAYERLRLRSRRCAATERLEQAEDRQYPGQEVPFKAEPRLAPGSGMSRALFGNNFRVRNRRNGAVERRPINFKFFNGVGVSM